MNSLATSTAISFKNILFLTDFSDASRAALVYALAFARHHNAKLFPAHVYNAVPVAYPENGGVYNFSPNIKEANLAKLKDLVQRNCTSFEPLLAEGTMEFAVQKWIEEYGIDLVVIGTHGRRGLQRFLLGSTAEAIFRTATCPVLTVGPHVSIKPYDESRIDKILFATDLTRESGYAVSYALSFAHERRAHITFLHVIPEEVRHHTDHSRIAAFCQEELKKLVPEDAELWCEPEFRVKEGFPAEEIISFAETELPDLIVLGLPKDKDFSTHFQTGVTYKVVASAPCPVLTVREMLK
jgi:nucleotide-binding universal stress UspA family protein